MPPTLISFAIAPVKAGEDITQEFKAAGHPVYLFGGADLTDYAGHRTAFEKFHALCRTGKVAAAWAVENGVAEGVMKMAFGNRVGFRADAGVHAPWYGHMPGAIVAERTEEVAVDA